KYLETHPLFLPAGIVPYIPNPIINLQHQNNCCHNLHGYINLASWCTCGKADNNIAKCKNICGSKRETTFEKKRIIQRGNKNENIDSENGLWVSSFSQPICDIEHTGDDLHLDFIHFASNCTKLDDTWYMLTSSTAKIDCVDQTCSDCVVNID